MEWRSERRRNKGGWKELNERMRGEGRRRGGGVMDRQRAGGEKGVDLKWIRPRSHKAIRFTHSVIRHGQHSVAYLNFTWGTKVQNAAHLICLYHFHLWRCVSCVDDSLTSLFTFSLNKIRIKDQVSSLSFIKAFFKAFYEAPYVKTRFLPVVSWYQNIISHQVSRHLTNISPVYYVSCKFICTFCCLARC